MARRARWTHAAGCSRGSRRPSSAALRARSRCSAIAAPRCASAFAAELDLAEPVLPWHASRGPVRELAAALDGTAAACGKIALDVVLLAQDGGRRGAVWLDGHLLDDAAQAEPGRRRPRPGVRSASDALVATFTCEHEHERAAGAWHAEWEPLSEALALTGGAAAHVRETLDGLEIDAARMRANLRAGNARRRRAATSSPETTSDRRTPSSTGRLPATATSSDEAASRRRGQRRRHSSSSSSLGTTHALWEPNVARAPRAPPRCSLRPSRARALAGRAAHDRGLARAALALADELGLARFTFCGLSLGGMVGMWLGANAPERLDRLVLCCTAPQPPAARVLAGTCGDGARGTGSRRSRTP